MTHYVYVLYSECLDCFYKGATRNISRRVYEHNRKGNKFTSKGQPWQLVWYTEKPTKKAAQNLERKLKNLSRKRLLQFISKYS